MYLFNAAKTTFEHCLYLAIASKLRHALDMPSDCEFAHWRKMPLFWHDIWLTWIIFFRRFAGDCYRPGVVWVSILASPTISLFWQCLNTDRDGELGSKFTSVGVRERQDNRENFEEPLKKKIGPVTTATLSSFLRWQPYLLTDRMLWTNSL